MNQESKLNIPGVSVTEVTRELEELYCSALEAGRKLSELPTPFFWGPAGIGKSQGVYEMAQRIRVRTKKRVQVTDVRLLLFSPVDLRGVPVADSEKRFTNWLMPKIFDMEPGEGTVNLLFLDELSAAPQSVQAAAYQICLDHRIGEFMLPDNCIVIAAGNRTTDQSVSYKMPKALCNRLMHFDIRCDYDSWRQWAVEEGIDPRIIAFLGMDPSRLCPEPESSDLAYPTPRSWSFVSTLLKSSGKEPKDLHRLIAACVGVDCALELSKFCKGALKMPSLTEIFAGRCRELPKSHDVMYATVSALVHAIREGWERLRVEEIDNACLYALGFPADFCMSFMKDLSALPQLKWKLMKCQGFQKWLSKNKRYG